LGQCWEASEGPSSDSQPWKQVFKLGTCICSKNRVQSSHLIDKTVIPATAVPLEKYFLEEAEILKIKDALINSVIEILVNHVPLLSHLKTMVTEEDHNYIEESKRKSEIVSGFFLCEIVLLHALFCNVN
jgi:hypothetical protein